MLAGRRAARQGVARQVETTHRGGRRPPDDALANHFHERMQPASGLPQSRRNLLRLDNDAASVFFGGAENPVGGGAQLLLGTGPHGRLVRAI